MSTFRGPTPYGANADRAVPAGCRPNYVSLRRDGTRSIPSTLHPHIHTHTHTVNLPYCVNKARVYLCRSQCIGINNNKNQFESTRLRRHQESRCRALLIYLLLLFYYFFFMSSEIVFILFT